MKAFPSIDDTPTETQVRPAPASERASVLEREIDASLRRAGSKMPPVAALQSCAEESPAPLVARGAVVSDALLEPEFAAGRDRRAAWADTGVPIVSLVVLAALLCAGWLL